MRLQWGRVGEDAEIPHRPNQPPDPRALQWGRVGEDAEILAGGWGGMSSPRFNGAASVKTRKYQHHPQHHGLQRASMGPRR